jgi:hypothetical protein
MLIHTSLPVAPDGLKHFKDSGNHKFSPDVFLFLMQGQRGETVVRVFEPRACCNPMQDCGHCTGK